MPKKVAPIITVRFNDEEKMRDARQGVRELSNYLGCSESEALWRLIRCSVLLLRGVEVLHGIWPRPEMDIRIKDQLPQWREIVAIVEHIKEGKI